jgi:hypothetical protein
MVWAASLQSLRPAASTSPGWSAPSSRGICPSFKGINTVLSNLKTTPSGAFHALKYRKYGQTYLADFTYRFNRRFDQRGLLATLIVDVARCKPVLEKVIWRGQADAGF